MLLRIWGKDFQPFHFSTIANRPPLLSLASGLTLHSLGPYYLKSCRFTDTHTFPTETLRQCQLFLHHSPYSSRREGGQGGRGGLAGRPQQLRVLGLPLSQESWQADRRSLGFQPPTPQRTLLVQRPISPTLHIEPRSLRPYLFTGYRLTDPSPATCAPARSEV